LLVPVKIWFDLANSPHVIFFSPLIHKLQEQGASVVVTTRDFAQTIPLADACGLSHQPIGRHGGRSYLAKAGNLMRRTMALRRYVRSLNVDLAVSHNSYDQAVAARFSGIPLLTLMDYEHQPANHISFRLASRVLVPTVFPDKSLRRFGAGAGKVYKYHGLKEEMYVSGYVPDPEFPRKAGIDTTKIVVTMRPPATMAMYHRFENPLFDAIVRHLAKRSDVTIVFIPRTEEQKREALALNAENLVVPQRAVNGLDLLYHSDVVIGAGGTMNREAAVLGTPVYTVFAGRRAAVDDYLIEQGRMIDLNGDQANPIERIRLEKKKPAGGGIQSNLLQEISDQILLAASRGKSSQC
jgi:predicted glycosyltransferase